MSSKKFGPQYLGADGRFTRERPDWMPPKGMHAPRLAEIMGEEAPRRPRYTASTGLAADYRLPTPKPFKTPVISEAAAERIAAALHVMLSEQNHTKGRR